MSKKLASKASRKAPAKKPVVAKKVMKPVVKQGAARKPAKPAKAVAKASKKMLAKKPVAAKKPIAKPALAKPRSVAKPAKKPAKPAVVSQPAAKPKPTPVKPAVKTPAPPPVAAPVAAKPSVKAIASAAKPSPQVKVKRTSPLNGANGVEYAGNLRDDDLRAMPESDYMNDVQLEFFRQRLIKMREEVLARELDVKERLHQREVFADPADRATAEEEHWLDLRLRERESMLMRKIEDSLRRIRDKEYGYCTKTGEAIGIPRLLARPTATVIVDVKGQDEKVETHFRDR